MPGLRAVKELVCQMITRKGMMTRFPAISFTVRLFSNMSVLGSYFLVGFEAASAKSYMTANPERTFWRFLSCGLNRLRFFIAR